MATKGDGRGAVTAVVGPREQPGVGRSRRQPDAGTERGRDHGQGAAPARPVSTRPLPPDAPSPAEPTATAAGKLPSSWHDLDDRDVEPHGFRRSLRSWMDNTHPEAGEAAEKTPAHCDDDPVCAAYQGSDMLEQRSTPVQARREFCAGAEAK